MEKKFSKEKWLEVANAQMEQGFISKRELDDALDIWVNEYNGKTKEQIEDDAAENMPDAWFV